MASIETHIEDTRIILRQADGCEEVHRWLDEFAKKYPPHIYLETHRKFRHNRKGLLEIKDLFGFIGQEAGKIHLIRDVELYVLNKPIHEVGYNELDELVEKAFKYL